MKIRQGMIGAFQRGSGYGFDISQVRVHAGLEAALKDVPEVKPFAFEGYPDHEVYLHPCGTVVDVPAMETELRAEIEDGACDCEGGQPWMRIYVEVPGE